MNEPLSLARPGADALSLARPGADALSLARPSARAISPSPSVESASRDVSAPSPRSRIRPTSKERLSAELAAAGRTSLTNGIAPVNLSRPPRPPRAEQPSAFTPREEAKAQEHG